MQPDDLFRLIDDAADLKDLELTLTDDWAQGRTAFGGLTAGILYQALKKLVTPDRVLRSITFNFVGPAATGVPLGFSWQVLREGKNATQISASLIQDGRVTLSALGCFAVDRDSEVTVAGPTRQLPSPPETPTFARDVPAGAPTFTQHIDLAITDGGAPFSGSDTANFKGWMRLRTTPKTFSDAHIITLVDAWPPTVLQMLTYPAPASTMSWNVELVHPHKPLSSDAWLYYEVETVQAHAGYAHTEAQVFSDAGELIAISRQLVAVFG